MGDTRIELEEQPLAEAEAAPDTAFDGDASIGPVVRLDEQPVLEWTVDRRLRLTWARGRPFFDLGLVPANLVGMRVTEAFGSMDSEVTPVQAHVRALDGESVRCRIRWGTRILQAEICPRRDSQGVAIGTVAAALDVIDSDRSGLRAVRGPVALPRPRLGRTRAATVRIS